MRISPDVVILTRRDLDEIERKAFLRGVERGKFEATAAYRDGPYARNCAHWSDGRCETCGVPWQSFEVDGDFKCPHFTDRRYIPAVSPSVPPSVSATPGGE